MDPTSTSSKRPCCSASHESKLQRRRDRERARHASETAAEKEAQLRKRRLRDRARRAAETEEQRETRLQSGVPATEWIFFWTLKLVIVIWTTTSANSQQKRHNYFTCVPWRNWIKHQHNMNVQSGHKCFQKYADWEKSRWIIASEPQV